MLLVVGGIGFVYGQMSLQNQQQSDDGGLVDVTVDDDDGGGGSVDRERLVRLLGLVVGVTGAVVALVGGMLG